jgi:hypothetical protein
MMRHRDSRGAAWVGQLPAQGVWRRCNKQATVQQVEAGCEETESWAACKRPLQLRTEGMAMWLLSSRWGLSTQVEGLQQCVHGT